MIDFQSCKKADGTFDHQKYNELQRKENEERKAKGELCQLPNCNRFIVWSRGVPQTCPGCKSLDNRDELNHDREIRCPKCGYHWSVFDEEDHDLYSEGEHEVTCHDCGYEFEIVTSISYNFQSPERLKGVDKDGGES